jgi:hypothetical protein
MGREERRDMTDPISLIAILSAAIICSWILKVIIET